MTVATVDPTPTGLAVVSPSTDLAQAVLNLRDASTFAAAVCGTSLVPAAYRGKPDEATVAILYGAEVGLQPMQSLQQVVVVKGSPGLYAKAAVALVIGRGHLIWVESSTPEKVVVCGRNRHWPADVPNVREEWDMNRAKVAGYYQQNKANYDGKPQEMLYARGAMNTARKVDAGAILGMPYSAEELADGDFVTGEVVAAPPAYVTPAIPAQRGDDEQPRDSMTAVQSRALRDGLRHLGITEIADCLAWCSTRTGRAIGVLRDLTKDEAARLIEEATLPPADTTTGEVLDLDVEQLTAPAAVTNDQQSAVAVADPISKSQSKMLHGLLGQHGMGERASGLAWMGSELDRELATSSDITKAEANQLINALNKLPVEEPMTGAEAAGQE